MTCQQKYFMIKKMKYLNSSLRPLHKYLEEKVILSVFNIFNIRNFSGVFHTSQVLFTT